MPCPCPQAGTTRGEQSQALSARLAELQAAYDATAQVRQTSG